MDVPKRYLRKAIWLLKELLSDLEVEQVNVSDKGVSDTHSTSITSSVW